MFSQSRELKPSIAQNGVTPASLPRPQSAQDRRLHFLPYTHPIDE